MHCEPSGVVPHLVVECALGDMLDSQNRAVDYAYEHAKHEAENKHERSDQNQTEHANDCPTKCCRHR